MLPLAAEFITRWTCIRPHFRRVFRLVLVTEAIYTGYMLIVSTRWGTDSSSQAGEARGQRQCGMDSASLGADTGQPLATLHGTGGALGVALSADGQLVTSRSFDGTVHLWEASTGTSVRILRPERRYERLDITGLTGVTDAQRAALRALGAIDRTPPASDRCAQPNVNA